MEEFGHEAGFVPAETARDFVDALQRPRRLMIMVQAGAATDAVIDEFAPLLESGDMIVDGGNAHFADTRRRETALRARGIHFVGAGVSGGEEGALDGPSIMVGGSKEAYSSVLGPMFDTISAHVDGEACSTHIGPDGAGHFVKIVHNSVEYADMQLIAEAYDLLRQAGQYSPAEMAEIFRTWNKGRLNSYLIEITAEVLSRMPTPAGRSSTWSPMPPDRRGTGRWTVQTALELASPVTTIAQATFARAASGQPALRTAYRPLPGGMHIPKSRSEAERFTSQVEQALYASKVIAYDQGFTMIQDAALAYGWDIDFAAVAGIWRGGCIIRAAFLDRIRTAHQAAPDLVSLLAEPGFAEEITAAQVPWREVVATAARRGVPAPAFAAALSYYDTLRADRLPAALLQGQRDYFGAHTYRRIDRQGAFHTHWAHPDRPETDV
ncbi:NADP-dependent phosphogluconate dehydrogenase [Streptomyces clavifer]|uniref:NADP-dependent phosphogluconate dehydrogenase n=1 Tax=Streptomyces clavifer TaxID=68188 RepID=UPI0037FA2854